MCLISNMNYNVFYACQICISMDHAFTKLYKLLLNQNSAGKTQKFFIVLFNAVDLKFIDPFLNFRKIMNLFFLYLKFMFKYLKYS
jgi:hypothetical protein